MKRDELTLIDAVLPSESDSSETIECGEGWTFLHFGRNGGRFKVGHNQKL